MKAAWPCALLVVLGLAGCGATQVPAKPAASVSVPACSEALLYQLSEMQHGANRSTEQASYGDCFDGWGVYFMNGLRDANPIYVFHRTATRWRFVGATGFGMSCDLFNLAPVYVVEQWEYDLATYPTGFRFCNQP